MATWKKVIVSGSDISLLANDANYLLSGDSGVTLSGSFSGSFEGDGSGLTGVVAQAANALTDGNGIADFSYDGNTAGVTVSVEADGGTLTVGASGVKVSDLGIDSAQLASDAVSLGKIADDAFNITASGDLTGQASITGDTVALGLTIAAGAVENSMLVNDSIYLAGGNGLTGDGSTALGASGSLAVGAGDGIIVSADAVSVDTGSAYFTSGVRAKISATNTTGDAGINMSYDESTGQISGSLVNSSITIGDQLTSLGGTVTAFSGSFQGDGSGLTGVSAQVEESVLFGDGLNGGTFDGSTAVTASVNTDGSTLTVGASGVKVSDAGITETQLNASVAGTGLSGGGGTALSVDYGSTSGTAAQGDTSVTFAGTANEIELSTNTFTTVGGGGSVTIGLTDDVTITQDLTVGRNLVVQGTASFQHTTDLAIADRFILLASGSTSAGDGGIVVQQTTQDTGEVFAFDNANVRWGVSGSFDASQNTFTPDAFMAAVVEGAGTDPDAAPARYDKKGNIFVGTDESIWIYS